MKTLSITKIAAMSLLVLGLLACRKEKPAPQPQPGPEQDPVIPEFTEGLRVVADYYADAYDCGYDDYALYFQLGETDSEGKFINDGIELSLDILVAEGSPTMFPAGKYYLTDGSYRSAGILPSVPTTLKEYLINNGMSLEGYTAAELASVVDYGYTSFYVQTSADKWWLAAVDEPQAVGAAGAPHHVGRDKLGLADRRDQNFGLAADRRQIGRAAVADRDRAVLMQQQHGHRLTHDVRAADNDAPLTLGVDPVLGQQLHDAGWRAGQEIEIADHNLADIDRMKRVHVLLIGDRVDDRLLADVCGHGHLAQDAVDARIVVQLVDQTQQLLLRGLSREGVFLAVKSAFDAGLFLVADVDLA